MSRRGSYTDRNLLMIRKGTWHTCTVPCRPRKQRAIELGEKMAESNLIDSRHAMPCLPKARARRRWRTSPLLMGALTSLAGACQCALFSGQASLSIDNKLHRTKPARAAHILFGEYIRIRNRIKKKVHAIDKQRMHCAGYIWGMHQNKELNKERKVDHTVATARHNP